MVDEVIQEFLLETRENLDVLDNELVRMEEVGADKPLLDGIFRSVHTIKGTCGFLELTRMERVAHVGEGLLSKLRDGELVVTPEIVDALLEMGDALRSMLDACENDGTDGTDDFPVLVERLAALRDGRPAEAVAAAPSPAAPTPAAPAQAPSQSVVAAGDDRGRGVAMVFGEPAPAPAPAPVPAPAPAPAPVAAAPASPKPAPPKEQTTRNAQADPPKKAENIRVDVSLLDKLMNLVGELVLARNQVLQFADSTLQGDAAFVSTSQRLNLITMELQEGVMKTRMQPIHNIWGKFPRMVRHLASVCGKTVRMEMEGQDTELDRTILEAIKDPLTHIIRNSVDHGIEEPAVRLAAGKPAEGTLRLRAFHESGQVNMEISDDGRGIDVERVKQRAIDRGLISADAARLSDREVLQLVFAPGFSTAAKVTNVSGRGVGMDVVKTNIERIGGTVDIVSEPGKGTTLRIKIPLTLAIIPTLIVESGAQRFAVPQVSLVELVRLDGHAAISKIEHIHGTPVYRLRGDLLPLVYLNDVLQLDGPTGRERVRDACATGGDMTVNIVVLQAYERQFGLVVDNIQDTAEIVVKPLGALLKDMDVFAGATILGDGRVALILDVLGTAQASNVLSEHRRASRTEDLDDDEVDSTQLLLVRCGENRRMAISLEDISRLEEFKADRIEHAGRGQQVIQYRQSILPLMSLSRELGMQGPQRADGASLPVLVCERDGYHVGIIVDEIVDVVEQRLVVHERKSAAGSGIVGSVVIDGRVTDIVNLVEVVRQSSVDLYQSKLA